MRFIPQRHGQLYTEHQPLWDIYTRNYTKSWYRPPLETVHFINHWRDFDGVRLPEVKRQDFQFNDWLQSRIRFEACLPFYYPGSRFIRLVKASPVGFKCAPIPLTISEARAIRGAELQAIKDKKDEAALKKKQEKEALKKKRNRHGGRYPQRYYYRMERGTGGGQQQLPQQPYYHHPHAHYQTFMTTSSDEHIGKSSFDNPATKKKPPKLKAINRSISMAIDNYDGAVIAAGGHLDDSSLIVEQPLIHRSASPVAIRSAPPPQTLALPSSHHMSVGHGGSGAISPALSARQHLHTFQHMAAQARQYSQQQATHTSSTSSPISHAVSPILGSSGRGGGSGGGGSGGDGYPSTASHAHHSQHQPDIYLVSSSSLVDDVGSRVGGGASSSSPIQFIDDYMLPPPHRQQQHQQQQHATHPLKKSQFRRSDTIDIHPASTFQMKKTHSFHAPHDPDAAAALMDPLLLSASGQPTSASSSRRTSSVRGNFLMPGHATGKDISRSPSPSRRGAKSHRSLHDPQRRPSAKPESVIDSQIRHPSLNDDLLDPHEGRVGGLLAPSNLSLENELFIESRSRSNSHTKMEDVGLTERIAMRKTSGSFEDPTTAHGGPAPTTSSLKKRDHTHSSRQHSTHSLELDGRPSTSAAAAAAAVAASGGAHSSLHLHSAAAAATAAYHFKRGAQHGRSLYLSPNNLEEIQVHHRPAVLAAAAAFGGTNASAASSIKQAKALHSASMRLRTYRETLSATKKSKSFIGDSAYPPPPVSLSGEFVELTSPHRRNSGRPMATATSSGGAATIEEIKRSPRPVSLGSTTSAVGSATTAFMEEKRPSFERKPSIAYEMGEMLRPFHHKTAAGLGAHDGDDEEQADRKRKRIVCIVMTVFLCLVCASVFVVIMTLTHSSGQTHPHAGLGGHHGSKKIYSYNRDVPVHYNVRQENERLMKETMERARFGKNYTEPASSLLAATTSSLASAAAAAAVAAVAGPEAAVPLAQPLQQQQVPPPPQTPLEQQAYHQQQPHDLPAPVQYALPHLQQIP